MSRGWKGHLQPPKRANLCSVSVESGSYPHYHTATWGVTWLRPGDQPGALSGGELFHRGPWGPAEENLAKNHQPKDQHTGDASASEPWRV